MNFAGFASISLKRNVKIIDDLTRKSLGAVNWIPGKRNLKSHAQPYRFKMVVAASKNVEYSR